MMIRSKHVIVSVNLWAKVYEQEWIYLEYFDDGDKIFLEYPYAT
jgi:hypothetical protein